ncbi:helix-turn-helix domain-containing protein [Limnoglobus roseus]|uniref:helix-turn-helix domain-containing protein n=1 Tax=Limnoglobus roseus TaxID=2598579 RepID=UPI0011EAAA6F
MTFGERLRELRADQTQEAIARAAGVPIGTYRNLEQGRRSPSWPNVVRLSRALNVTSATFDGCDEVALHEPAKKRAKKRHLPKAKLQPKG